MHATWTDLVLAAPAFTKVLAFGSGIVSEFKIGCDDLDHICVGMQPAIPIYSGTDGLSRYTEPHYDDPWMLSIPDCQSNGFTCRDAC
jgi:hypothetical protein